jgi:hypothetical protein
MSHVSTAHPDAALRLCRYCQHFGKYTSGGVWCLNNERVCATGMGCVFFVREPGTDDDVPRMIPASADRPGAQR